MLTNSELIDSIIGQMYDMFKGLVSGNYMQFCAHFAEIMSKLVSLRDGVKNDTAAKDAQIADLLEQLKRATTPTPAEPGETVIGGQTYQLNLMPEE